MKRPGSEPEARDARASVGAAQGRLESANEEGATPWSLTSWESLTLTPLDEGPKTLTLRPLRPEARYSRPTQVSRLVINEWVHEPRLKSLIVSK